MLLCGLYPAATNLIRCWLSFISTYFRTEKHSIDKTAWKTACIQFQAGGIQFLMPSKFCYCVVNDAYENSWHLWCIIIWYHILHGLLVLVFYVMSVCCAVQFTMVMKTTDDVALTVLTILHQQCTKVYFW